MKQLEKRAGLLYDSGTGSTADVRLAKASRLQAEIDLLLATEMGESVLPNAEAISVPPDDKLRQLLVERRDSLNEYATLALIDFHRGWIRSTFVVQAQADSLMRA